MWVGWVWVPFSGWEWAAVTVGFFAALALVCLVSCLHRGRSGR